MYVLLELCQEKVSRCNLEISSESLGHLRNLVTYHKHIVNRIYNISARCIGGIISGFVL
jgi:hypothetical protein